MKIRCSELERNFKRRHQNVQLENHDIQICLIWGIKESLQLLPENG